MIDPDTKTHKDRRVPVWSALEEFMDRLKKVHELAGWHTDFLFPADIFGNSPQVLQNNYYAGLDLSLARDVLERRSLSG